MAPALAQASGGARFDLTGPRIDVHVQRGDKSLPIAMVPNLQPGDKLTIRADLPSTQSVKMILVVAFLRGSTNPPPESWFTEVKTWEKKTASEGTVVTVPNEAQQALVFLAPETGGDYSTLKSAVTGRPGIFVRAAQDLNEASFEQARIERYVQALMRVPTGSSSELLDHSKKLAATLNLKPNDDCFKKPADQQLACLRQSGTQLLLDDGHGQTLAAALTSGDSATLASAFATTPVANAGGAGLYSAYVGTVIDLVHLMAGIHTAKFQYIPAIAFPDEETLNLRLNAAPSFHNPKSVIVVAMPAIQKSVAPPLALQDPNHVSCLLQPSMVLPLQGAPLVFATGFAHDLTLHLNQGSLNGRTDLPLRPDAFEGGLVVTDEPERKPLPVAAPEARDSADNPIGMPAAKANHGADVAKATPQAAKLAKHPSKAASTGAAPVPAEATPAAAPVAGTSSTDDMQVTGTLHGSWGFDSFDGVTVPLQRRAATGWTAVTQSDLIAGKSNDLTLRAEGTACASSVQLEMAQHSPLNLQWKAVGGGGPNKRPQALDVKLALEKSAPGTVHLLVHQYGTDTVAKVAVTTYSDATRVEALGIHAGDSFATLEGTGLGEVRSVKLEGVEYKPTPDQSDGKHLRLATTTDPKANKAAATAGQSGDASVTLADGRTLPVHFSVDAARPTVELLSKSAKPTGSAGLPLTLNGKDDLPLNAKLTFALRSDFPQRFPRDQKIEIALADGSLKTTVSLADGSLVLQDARTALAFLLPQKAFGDSAFGPLQLRPVAPDGTVGDWIPLGTLVRTPTITGITCSRSASRIQPSTSTGASPAQDGGDAQASTATGTTADTGCQVTGSGLFLIGTAGSDSTFSSTTEVPLGFAGDTFPVPRPADNRTLYLRLRDDPEAVFTVAAPASLGGVARRPSTPAPTAPPASTPPATVPTQPPANQPQTATPAPTVQ